MREKNLRDVLSLPTAAFHENDVANYIAATAKRLRCRIQKDRYGNILVRYKKGGGTPVVLTAHMDHPGFEVLSSKGKVATVGILGGIKPAYFRRARVAIKTTFGIVKGIVRKKLRGKKWRKKPAYEILTKSPVKKGDFGWYDLPGFKKMSSLVYTKGADNIASVAVLLDLLSHLAQKRVKADVRCVFTRAEEVGFVGCISLAKSGIIPKSALIIVLECSSASAGHVEIGGGPVIRVGDKLTSYSSKIDTWLKKTASDLSKKDKGFKFQRSLLAGGTCEASIWALGGYKTGGLAFPLGNYHNNGKKSYAPEFISIKDYRWMLKFLIAIAISGMTPDEAVNKELSAIRKNYRMWIDLLR